MLCLYHYSVYNNHTEEPTYERFLINQSEKLKKWNFSIKFEDILVIMESFCIIAELLKNYSAISSTLIKGLLCNFKVFNFDSFLI